MQQKKAMVHFNTMGIESKRKKEFQQQKARIQPINESLMENCPLPITDRKL